MELSESYCKLSKAILKLPGDHRNFPGATESSCKSKPTGSHFQKSYDIPYGIRVDYWTFELEKVQDIGEKKHGRTWIFVIV